MTAFWFAPIDQQKRGTKQMEVLMDGFPDGLLLTKLSCNLCETLHLFSQEFCFLFAHIMFHSLYVPSINFESSTLTSKLYLNLLSTHIPRKYSRKVTGKFGLIHISRPLVFARIAKDQVQNKDEQCLQALLRTLFFIFFLVLGSEG